MFEYGNGPTIDMIHGKQVVDLTDVLGDAKSDFTPALLERMTYQGKLYAVPQVIDMQLLVYRKSLLEKAGVQPPQTIDELLAAAKTLTTGNVKGLFLGNDGGVGVLGGPCCGRPGSTTSPRTTSSASTTRAAADGARQAPRPVTPTGRCCWVRPTTGPTPPRSARGSPRCS